MTYTYRVVYAIDEENIVTFEFDSAATSTELVIEEAIGMVAEEEHGKDLVGFSILRLKPADA
ncbi:hypothetical protein ACP26L_36030 (plasmid) [Paenibacillus sp. S-38]|uniref:hypothetical protein n=1 Tax=Paenibacillus sp. S-38 TaxID=3416710 RepID=UPI003CE737E6